ncbi:MAG: hypothetical protein M1831_001035 [Alyxoria varia]|nr:MAG: hypothetical protein M1831_001035 [Alyxoria varia]
MNEHDTTSIEQSVRLFRLYEALRSGDTKAVANAIKESCGETTRTSSDGSVGPSTIVTAPPLEGTSILHLAIQCADVPVIEFILQHAIEAVDVNGKDKEGNTPLHLASNLGRAPVVKLLLNQKNINDTIPNYQGRTALDLAKSPEVFQQLQLARSMYIDARVNDVHVLVANGDYDGLEKLLTDPHFQSAVDVNGGELVTDPMISQAGGNLLHEAARKKDANLIQVLLLNGADPFKRDKKGKLPQDITKDDKTRSLLKKSPAAAAAQRGIQEKTILGSNPSQANIGNATTDALGNKEAREMKGYLKKWTNYTSGYKLRWFCLENGVLSYYKHQDDAGSACRGAINMKIAKLHMDPTDKVQFEIHGKSSVKYHLKANHQVEAKRWFWSLNNAIQWAKDEAKEEQKQKDQNDEMMRQAKSSQAERLQPKETDGASVRTSKSLSRLVPATAVGLSRTTTEDNDGTTSVGEPSEAGDDVGRLVRSNETAAITGDIDNDEEYGDDASSVEAKPANRDAFMIAAHSARLQLDLLAQISGALQAERTNTPEMTISEPTVMQAVASYEAAVTNLKGLVGDMGRIARDREAYWHYRLEQEINMRRVWEESMAKVAKEQEDLENRYGESEEKRKKTKRALRDALGGNYPSPAPGTPSKIQLQEPPATQIPEGDDAALSDRSRTGSAPPRRTTISAVTNISDSESDVDEEFFDAIDEGKVEVMEDMPPTSTSAADPVTQAQDEPVKELRAVKQNKINSSFRGYEDIVRTRLKMDEDDRPKISLWGILKSMIGKDMTKMTLPVSFNEPTSLLQRVAEDLEYSDVLDVAADRHDSSERMLYVAAFAASEYASTIGRVAKPFNPLLGETYEYARPDKGYRFVVEQVSHHPPVGAAFTESPKWDYYGESALKSKFYGKAFDINLLGTWFLNLRPSSNADGTPATEELYTWKKVTSSVIGIITGNPTVDNYGTMEIKNHNTGEVCRLEFKPRGWKASSAYQVQGKVLDANGTPRWSIGGRWNDKIYAREATAGGDDALEGPMSPTAAKRPVSKDGGGNAGAQAFLVWEAHERPAKVPFNLTPFVMTLNALPERLKPNLPPTDTRLRPDQRAMEDGEYDLAAKEKNRVEEKQRAKRREREQDGDEYSPRWFVKRNHKVTGEDFWDMKRKADSEKAGGDGPGKGDTDYWACRDGGDWQRCEDIF